MNNTLTCPVCQATGPQNDFEGTPTGNGAWCPECNSFIWFEPNDNHQRNTLILETKTSYANKKEVFPHIPYKLNKRLSPIRYPGGKSKLIDYLFTKLQLNKCNTFVEVFAGGCSFGLALLDAGIINHLVINDKDSNLITFWKEVLEHPEALIHKLQTENPTHSSYTAAKGTLSSNGHICPTERAWAYLLVNRCSYSGIQKGGCLGGKNGSNDALLSRYNPKRLIKQIKRISELKDRITVLNQDYVEYIENYYWDDKTTLFIDPPYYEKGKLLYNHYFTEEDHRTLSELLTKLNLEFPDAADVLITYDDVDFITNLYWSISPTYVKRQYSI